MGANKMQAKQEASEAGGKRSRRQAKQEASEAGVDQRAYIKAALPEENTKVLYLSSITCKLY